MRLFFRELRKGECFSYPKLPDRGLSALNERNFLGKKDSIWGRRTLLSRKHQQEKGEPVHPKKKIVYNSYWTI